VSKKVISILTPTYNRAYLLDNLYRSIVSQTNQDFIWLVIDDGSTDNTREKVESYIKENRVTIQYFYQHNGGKYIAHNTGVKLCETELIVCVDSDDELYPQAIEKTLKFWSEIKDDTSIAGIVSPKQMGGLSYFNNPPRKSTLMELYNSGKLVGETMLVYRTEILREFLFPEVSGEKFMSECVIYNQIDRKYFLAIQNEYLYKAEYQNDGLTRNIVKTHWNNPRTTLIMYQAIAAFESNFAKAAKAYGCYLAWKKLQRLSKCELYRVKSSVKLTGLLLQCHYIRLFRRQKENSI
jgi:glycosyltransferase involved in cell wall biosynthesis